MRSGREQCATREQVTLGDMAEFLGERSIVGLLLAFALLMVLLVPAPGLSVLFGVPLMVLSAQLTLGYRRAWLPARLASLDLAFHFLDDRRPNTPDVAVARAHCSTACATARRPLGEGAGWHHLSCAGNHHYPPGPPGSCGPGNRHLHTPALGLIERDGVAITLGIFTAVLGLAIVMAASAGILHTAHLWWG